MGLFDKILKSAVDAIDNAAAKNGNGPTGLKDLFDQAMDKKAEAIGGTSSSNQQTVQSVNTAVAPAKPSREVSYDYCDGENAEIDMRATFMLSGDFIETETGAAEIDYAAMYLPNCDDDFDNGYSNSDTPYIQFVNAPQREIYDMIKNCKNGGTPDNAMMFLRVNDLGDNFYFKAKIKNKYGKVEYFYACSFCQVFDICYIGVSYKAELVGTPLEKKLMTALDEVVRSYKAEIM